MAYAASRIVITRGDSGRTQFNTSEFAGNAVAVTPSNAYYPAADKALSATLSRWGMQLMWDALSNELKKFWPGRQAKAARRNRYPTQGSVVKWRGFAGSTSSFLRN